MKKSTQNTIAGVSIAAIIIGCFIATGIQSSQNNTNLDKHTPSAHNEQQEEPTTHSDTEKPVEQPKIETKTETSTKVIPHTTKYVDDNSLPKGQTKTTTYGVDGIETITYEVTYTDGIETSREVIDSTITKQPVTEVIARGTYVAPQPTANCPNGTYVNSAGNTVCRPTSSPSRPAGATAQCNDDSYSYSQSRRGTCSHHGGVKTWF